MIFLSPLSKVLDLQAHDHSYFFYVNGRDLIFWEEFYTLRHFPIPEDLFLTSSSSGRNRITFLSLILHLTPKKFNVSQTSDMNRNC